MESFEKVAVDLASGGATVGAMFTFGKMSV
jgi:hypothetical protein